MILADTPRGSSTTGPRAARSTADRPSSSTKRARWSSEPVVMEVMAGARDDRRERARRRLLLRFDLLTSETAADFDAAARIYRRCRRIGFTPRGMVDCLIAFVARRHQATILAHDADLARIAQVVGIELDEASLHA